MTPFLQQVARHYHPAPEISRMCFVFPNKRAVSFFRKYLGEECARAHQPLIVPECLAVNDFFYRLRGLRPADRLGSMLTLYDCYKDLNPNAEPLDEFIFWGGVILSDFSEVDKYLVDPEHIFKNIADFRHLQDSFDYLEPGQKDALERFLGQFKTGGEYKERFRRIWDMLLPLYHSFNERLAAAGQASEGAVYRYVAERLDSEPVADLLAEHFPDREKFVFAGLNALNNCEKKVLHKMKDAKLAEFCWDWVSEEIRDPANRAAFFLSQNIAEFPQAFTPDPDGLPRPVINVVSCPSSVGQAKLLPSIFDSFTSQPGTPTSGVRPSGSPHHPFGTVPPLSMGSLKNHSFLGYSRGCYAPQREPPAAEERSSFKTAATLGTIRGGTTQQSGVVGSSDSETVEKEEPSSAAAIDINTAIVLPDEGLLIPVLNSIPEEVQDVNVTMGYPMHGSEFQALLNDLAMLQTNTREKNGSIQFYHKYVWGIFSNSILRSIVSEEGKTIISGIRKEARYYIGQEAFAADPLLSCIFRPAGDNVPGYIRELILTIAPLLKQKEGMQMELDFAMYAYKAATRLEGLQPDVQPRTMWRLFDQLTGRTAVPFKGEPLKGLQIMGPLETRALDFRNLVILSCNEGIFPRKSVSASFIPAELRRGFGLPTYEYQDSVWAYYFYRLIQRAENVWLLFDSRTELSRSGEESRYIRQLEMLYGFDVRRHVIKAPIVEAAAEGDIAKTADDIARMEEEDFHLSASSLKDYLCCPARFYYSRIRGLSAADEVNESLDAGMVGSILHKTMELLYKGRPVIQKDYIKGILDNPEKIRAMVASQIMETLKTDEVEGRNLIFEELICKYVQKVLETDLGFLKQSGKDGFRILGLELPRGRQIGPFRFTGVIDRLDSFEEGAVRVVDYKTGKVSEDDISIDDGNAGNVVEKLFGPDNAKRPKIALQLYIYDELIAGDKAVAGKQIENCIYQTTNIFVEAPKSVPQSGVFHSLMKDRLAGLLDEIRDTDVPWRRTADKASCEWCDFKTLCGR